MSTPTPATLVAVAMRHYGERSPQNTCVSHGAYAMSLEAGLPVPRIGYDRAAIKRLLGTDYGSSKYTWSNVTAFEAMAREGQNGWSFVGPADMQVGDWAIWPGRSHISLIVELPGGRVRSIGAGGPTGQVFQQPQGGGGNSRSYFIGAARPPYAKLAADAATAAKAALAAKELAAKLAAEAKAAAQKAAEKAAAEVDAATQAKADAAAAQAAAAADAAAHADQAVASLMVPTPSAADIAALEAHVDELVAGNVDTGAIVTKWLRQVVPFLYSSALTAAAGALPAVGQFWDALPDVARETVVGGTVVLLGAGWYAIGNKLGESWPIVARIMLGSSRKPSYRANGN